MKYKILLFYIATFFFCMADAEPTYLSLPMGGPTVRAELREYLSNEEWQSYNPTQRRQIFNDYCCFAKDATSIEMILHSGISFTEDTQPLNSRRDTLESLYTNRYLSNKDILALTKKLIAAGVPTDKNYLYTSCNSGEKYNQDMLAFWLERGAHVDELTFGGTTLSWLCLTRMNAHLDDLDEKASAEEIAKAKLLDEQSMQKLKNCILYLLEQGANINGQPAGAQVSNSPLGTASSFSNLEIMELLISHGADVNFPSLCTHAPYIRGFTPMHSACLLLFREEAIDLLLAHGADINARTSQGFTPLMVYLMNNSEDALPKLPFLLERGADAGAWSYALDVDEDGSIDIPPLPTFAFCGHGTFGFSDLSLLSTNREYAWLLFKSQSLAELCAYAFVLLIIIALAISALFLLYRLFYAIYRIVRRHAHKNKLNEQENVTSNTPQKDQ